MPLKYGLIEPVDLPLPHVPAALEGLRIAHLSDLHITRPRRRYERLIHQLTSMRLDLVFFTGDYMTRGGDEAVAAEVLGRLSAKLRPALGCFGVFGNHDTDNLRTRCANLAIRWLNNEVCRVDGKPIEVLGTQMLYTRQPDLVAMVLEEGKRRALNNGGGSERERPLRLMLAHKAEMLVAAAWLGRGLSGEEKTLSFPAQDGPAIYGVDVMFSGHTHGGQCRLPWWGGGRALVNSSDLPLGMTSGMLRYRRTLALVSRGVGEVGLPLRLFCPPHVPVYTLRRRSLPGEDAAGLHRVWGW